MENEWTQQEEARQLEERFAALKRKKIGQAEFAREFGLPGGASMISQHIKGRRPINLAAATIYAKGFGVRLDEISPRLAREVKDAGVNAPAVDEIQKPVISHSDENNSVASLLLRLTAVLQPLSSVTQDFAVRLIAEAVRSPELAAAHAVRLEGLLKLESGIHEATGTAEESHARVHAKFGPTKKYVPDDETTANRSQGKGG